MNKTNYKAIRSVFNKFSPFGKLGCSIYDVEVCFRTTNVDGLPITIKTSLGNLCDDWYGDCEICPENDANIEFLEVMFGGKIERVKENYLKNFVFEDMMAIVEEIWV